MGLKCIIIDDSLFIREMVQSIIEDAGHEMVATFENGPSFLNNISKYNPDIVFCDIILPEMTGLDLLTLISEGFPNAKIIMLSGVTQGEAISAALRLGAIDFIQKPIEKDRLLLILDKLTSTTVPPSIEELSIIGVGCTILNGFFEEIVAHTSATLQKIIEQQIRSILMDYNKTTTGMLEIDVIKKVIEPDPELWGNYSEQQVMSKLRAIPQELKFELQFLYDEDYVNTLFNQAILTMGSRKRFLQLFEKVSPETVGLPKLPEYGEISATKISKAGTTYEELNQSISVAFFLFDIKGPKIVSKHNPDLLAEEDLMRNSVFYYTLIGEDDETFQEGLFGPLPVSTHSNGNLSSLAYTTKLPDNTGERKVIILSIFYAPSAEGIISDYTKLSFLLRTRLAALDVVEDLDKTVIREIVDDIIDFILDIGN